MRDFLVLNGEWFDYKFANFALGQEADIVEAREFLTKPQYRVAQTGETYRVINNWDEKGLLFDNEERENGWRKFSLTELMWIHCLRELRTFGFSMVALKKLKETLFIFDTPQGKEFNQIELSFFITEVVQKRDVILVVSSEGRGSICLVADYEKSQIIRPLPTSYVVISINKLYGEITKQPKYKKQNTPLFVLSEKEQKILYEVAFGDVQEVKMTTKENKIHKVEFKKNTQNPDDVFSKIRNELKDGKRKRILLEVQDGRIIAMENTEKT